MIFNFFRVHLYSVNIKDPCLALAQQRSEAWSHLGFTRVFREGYNMSLKMGSQEK